MSFLSGVELLVFVLVFTMALAMSVPLTGTLVRYRASYNPRGLALDAEGGAAPYTGPVVNSFFGMMARVYRIEGWAGLYKGFIPTMISGFIISVFAIAFLDASKPTGGRYNTPDGGPLVVFLYSMFYTVVALPAMVITYRAIITPYRLPSFNPSIALRVLLTSTERSRPWTLYLTPGLFATQVVHILYVVFVVGVLGKVLLKTNSEGTLDFEAWRIGAYLALVVLSTIILTPLEVISTRLAIQRNHDSGVYSSTQETEAVEDLADFYGDSEDVIGLRSEGDPYLGMMDCAKRIIDEEGVRALYRGWWVTALGALMKA